MRRLLLAVLVIGGFCFLAYGSLPDSSTNSSSGRSSASAVPTKPATTKTDADFTAEMKAAFAALQSFDGSKFRAKGKEGVNSELVILASAGIGIGEAERRGTPELKEQAVKMRRLLAAIQVKEFPLMRKAWVETVAEKLWEENIKVQVRGTGNSTIRSVGGTFANNKSIKQFQEGLDETLTGLRFKRAEYLWIPSADNYTYYTLKTPGDAEILLTAPK